MTGEVWYPVGVMVLSVIGLMWKMNNTMDKNYVRKDMCKVIHKSVSDDLAEIKADVKTLLGKKH